MIPDIAELKDVALISSGNSAPQDQDFFKQGSFNFYRTSDVGKIHIGPISNSLDKLNQKGTKGLKLFNIGTILFPKSGASTFLNHRAILEKEGYVSSHLAAIKANNKFLLDKFLFYLLTTIDAKDLVQDASYPSLKLETIEKIKFQLPSLSVQQKIVSKLDAIFLEIEKAVAASEANIKNAEALFQSYLTEVFECGIENWESYQIQELGEVITGNTPKTNEKENYGDFISFVKPGDFNPDGVIDLEKQKLSMIGMSKSRVVEKNSALMVCIGATIGKCGYVDVQVVTNQQINSITPKPNFNHKFIYFQMLTNDFQSKVIKGSGQATLPIINKSKWQSLVMKFPSLTEQLSIVDKFDNLRLETDILKKRLIKKIEELTLLKQSVLQQAFNGELVKE